MLLFRLPHDRDVFYVMINLDVEWRRLILHRSLDQKFVEETKGGRFGLYRGETHPSMRLHYVGNEYMLLLLPSGNGIVTEWIGHELC